MPIYLDLYEDREGSFIIGGMTLPVVEVLQRRDFIFRYKKEAIKEFKKLCKGL